MTSTPRQRRRFLRVAASSNDCVYLPAESARSSRQPTGSRRPLCKGFHNRALCITTSSGLTVRQNGKHNDQYRRWAFDIKSFLLPAPRGKARPLRPRCPGVRATCRRRPQPGSPFRWNPPEPAQAPSRPHCARKNRSSSLFRLGGDAISQLVVKKPNKNNDTILWLPKGQTEKREESGPVRARKPAHGEVRSQSILEKMSRKHAVMATKSPDRERRGLRVWWCNRTLDHNSLSGHVSTGEYCIGCLSEPALFQTRN